MPRYGDVPDLTNLFSESSVKDSAKTSVIQLPSFESSEKVYYTNVTLFVDRD